MGMFTRIIHPKDGRELQIKSGYDDCETYHVGDTVSWYINKSWPRTGKLLDDVYDSYDDDWVVIKDHVVVAVVDREAGDYNSLRERFEIQDIPDSAWPEEAWIKQREAENRHEKEYSEFLETIKHLSGKERLAAIFSYPIRKMLNYKSISSKVFSSE